MDKENVFESHPDLVDVENSVNRAWYDTADALAEATFKVTGVWQDPSDNFWDKNSRLFQDLEAEDANRLMDEFEDIGQRRREIDRQYLEAELKSQRIRKFGQKMLEALRQIGF